MFFKNLDYLSPPVTVYHQGSLSHSSILSGILSIFSFLLIIAAAFYFLLDIIKRQNPTAFYFNSFVEDSETFPLNASSFFHFISLSVNFKELDIGGVDFTSFRIIGFDNYFQAYLINNKDLSKMDHWLYGVCNNETDTQGIGYLIKYDFFKKSACIRKYFDSTKQKYYDTNDPEFKWPVIAHGTFNPNNKFYTVVIEKCNESTVNLILGEGSHCRNDSEINRILGFNGGASLYYIDNYVDVLDYKKPITKFFNIIENAMQLDHYFMNHLNFNPTLIKTHNGLIFDNVVKELSYAYERNDVLAYPNENEDILAVYCLWLKNRMNYYERTYKTIQEVFSSIGGIYQVIIIVAININRLYNNYIILLDSEQLLSNLIKLENHSSNKNKIKLENKKINDIKNVKNNEKSISQKQDLKNNSEAININESGMKKLKNHSKNNISKNDDIYITDFIGDMNGRNKSLEKHDKNEIKNENENEIKSNDKSFLSFIIFKLSCNSKNNYFQTYNDFRKKIISEEHIIRNHLNLYYIVKNKERKKHSRKRLKYNLKEIINFV